MQGLAYGLNGVIFAFEGLFLPGLLLVSIVSTVGAFLSCYARSLIKQCTIAGGGPNLKAGTAAMQLSIDTWFVFGINEVRDARILLRKPLCRHPLVTSILTSLSRLLPLA